MYQLSELKHVHCIGIGGIGLSAIAEIFLSRGCKVSGSDMKESEITEKLTSSGAEIATSHAPENIKNGIDLVIYSSAIATENPELLEAKSKGIPTASRAEILGALMEEAKLSIAISGTHGKTTTTSMVSLILEHAKTDPTILVGGNLPEFNGNVKIGKGSHFVTEACEYMDSFLSLRPTIEIILNIDSDHLDYFKDIDHIVHSFKEFAALVPEDGCVIAYDSNAFVNTVISELNCKVITFGFSDKSDYYASNIQFNSLGMPSFDLCYRGEVLHQLQLSIPGEHNIANALAAAACCRYLDIPVRSIAETLESYTGTQRRFDVIGVTKDNVRIVDDYAHHPTEIKATLKAAKNIPHKNLWCLFQPHTYTRTMALFHDFADSFGSADKIIITDIYAAREKNIYKISSKELVNEIKTAHPDKEIYYIPSFEEISDFVIENSVPGDLVITMGAGDIYKVAEMILVKDMASL